VRGWGEREEVWGKGGGGGKGGEMTQTLYAYMNKRNKIKQRKKKICYPEYINNLQ
jgi:hypothetical protein